MNWLDRKIDDFIRHVRDTKPKIPIGPNPEDPTMWRYFVIRRNRWFNMYLHYIRGDDPDHLHDHRMLNISFPLDGGGYFEERFVRRPREGLPLPEKKTIFVSERRPKFRLPATPHRIVLRRNEDGLPIPGWSLFIGFPHWRNWGFWTDLGALRTAKWFPWNTYTHGSEDPTSSGYGSRPGVSAP